MGFQEEEMPGQQPDPEFKVWFAGPWKQLTEAVEVPGMKYASWDRKAAYLLWDYSRSQAGFAEWCALWLDDTTAPPQRTVTTIADRKAVGLIVGKMTPEARQAWLEGDWRDPLTGTQWDVNHEETDACPDYPEGVVSGFDSAKW